MVASEFRCQVRSHRMLTPDVLHLSFDTDRALEFEAGQYMHILFAGAGPQGADLKRTYSIASSPEQRPVDLMIQLAKDGPEVPLLRGLRPGAEFKAVAPCGRFAFEPKPGRHACFIATGTGIAPFRSMLFSRRYRENPPMSTTFLLGVRTEAELAFLDDMARLPNVNWIPCVSQPTDPFWEDFRGRVSHYLGTLGEDFPWKQTEFYLCGSREMVVETIALLAKRGVAPESIHKQG